MDVPSSFTPKSFWSKPEGTVGMVAVLCLVGATVYGVSLILPFLITLLENAITFAALVVVVLTVAWFVSQPRTWTLIAGIFKSIMFHLTNLFITIDPVGILRNHIKETRDDIEKMSNSKTQLRAQMAALQNKKDANQKDIDKAIQIIKLARNDDSKKLVLFENTHIVDRKQKSNTDYADLLAKIKAMYDVLGKYIEAAQFMADDIEADVEEAIEKKKLIDQASRAMGWAKKILMGKGDETAVYNQSMDYLADQYGRKLGEIQDFMDVSKPLIDGVDLDNTASANAVLAHLDEWMSNTDSVVLKDSPKGQGLITEGDSMPATSLLKIPTAVKVKVAR